MVDINDFINDFREERSCTYKGEEYLARDNGAVLRKARPGKKTRKNDNIWTLGKSGNANYLFFFDTETNQ